MTMWGMGTWLIILILFLFMGNNGGLFWWFGGNQGAWLLNGMNNNNNMLVTDGIGVSNLMYGHAYTPNQTFSTIYSSEQGLAHGTMFPELVSYYAPNQSLATMNYLRNASRGGCCNGLR